jgi:hypothetical protein
VDGDDVLGVAADGGEPAQRAIGEAAGDQGEAAAGEQGADGAAAGEAEEGEGAAGEGRRHARGRHPVFGPRPRSRHGARERGELGRVVAELEIVQYGFDAGDRRHRADQGIGLLGQDQPAERHLRVVDVHLHGMRVRDHARQS